MLSVIPTASASAKFHTVRVNTANVDGLIAIISTGQGTGSPPPFAFTAQSPDSFWQVFRFAVQPINSCLDAGIEHMRAPGSFTANRFYIYNWCVSPAAYISTIPLTDAAFRGKYVRLNTWNDTGTAFQDETLQVQVVKSGANTWNTYLYNYSTSVWDLIASRNGTYSANTSSVFSYVDDGSTQDAPAYCPTLYPWGILQFRGMQKHISGVWSALATSDITTILDNSYCFANNIYDSTQPNPWQLKIRPYGVAY